MVIKITIKLFSLFLLIFNNLLSISQTDSFVNLKKNPKFIRINKINNKILFSETYFLKKNIVEKKVLKRNFIKIKEIKYKYNKNKMLSEEIHLNLKNKKDTEIFTNKYSYNSKNLINKVIYKYNDKILKIKDSINYNDKSQITSNVIFYPSSENPFVYIKEHDIFQYNEDGTIKSIMVKNKNGGFIRYGYKYNKFKDITEIKISQKLNLNSISKKDDIYIYKYKYDKYKNWVKRFILVNDKFKVDIKRKIKY